jgi:L-aminopeptidase/D-esterase-like protein
VFSAWHAHNGHGEMTGTATIEERGVLRGLLDPLFDATVQATEEAILNALLAAETLTGAGGRTAHALPHDAVKDVLRKHQRVPEPKANWH